MSHLSESESTEYMIVLDDLQKQLAKKTDRETDISVRAHKLSVKKEQERLTHLDTIQQDEIKIRMYQDAYQMVVGSKWWKLTKPIRFPYEWIQKHILHKMTLTESLNEIFDSSRYDRLDYQIRPKDVYLTSIKEFAEGEKEAWNVLTKEYKKNAEWDVCVSVVIPTYNAGRDFLELLADLRGQVGVKEIEIIVVDSGSADETLDICKMFDATVIRMKPEEFSHSYARNLGAEKAKGDYLLVMTQDALPTDEAWLYRMISVLEAKMAVAVSPKEIESGKGDLKYYADSYAHAKYLGLESGDFITAYREDMDAHEKRRNAQLTDVSCLIRRDIFEKYRYEGDYAEDLNLGLRLIKDGHHLALLSSVCVKHSHNRDAEYIKARSFQDRVALCNLIPELLDGCMEKHVLQMELLEGQEAMKSAMENMQSVSAHFNNIVVYGREMEHCLKQACNGMEYQLISAVCYYLKYVLLPYVEEHNAFVTERLHEQIKDALWKAYNSEVGTQLANYYLVKQDTFDEIEKLNQERV